MSTEAPTAPKSPNDFTVNGTAGLALMHALNAQQEFATRLVRALMASGALSAEAAQSLLVETANAIEGGMPKAPATPAGAKPLPYFVMIVERLRNHAKALRGIAGGLVRRAARG